MNTLPDRTGSHSIEPAQSGAHPFEQEWLSVNQAVTYCAELGLVRTPKTVRKWAERSSGLPDGDVLSRKQDTMWGYRWQIEKASLSLRQTRGGSTESGLDIFKSHYFGGELPPRNSDTDVSCYLLSADLQHEGDQICRNGSNIIQSLRLRSRWKR